MSSMQSFARWLAVGVTSKPRLTHVRWGFSLFLYHRCTTNFFCRVSWDFIGSTFFVGISLTSNSQIAHSGHLYDGRFVRREIKLLKLLFEVKCHISQLRYY